MVLVEVVKKSRIEAGDIPDGIGDATPLYFIEGIFPDQLLEAPPNHGFCKTADFLFVVQVPPTKD